MKKKSLHEYHFVINKGLKEKLLRIKIFKETKSVSGIIMKIIMILVPVISKEHKWGKQRLSRYLPVCNDPEETRENIHVYIPEELYRRLKLLHQDLNIFSIAQLVRQFLEFFIGLVERYGSNIFSVLSKVFKRWQKEDGIKNLSIKEILRQLFSIIIHIPQGSRVISIYDETFSPFWVLQI